MQDSSVVATPDRWVAGIAAISIAATVVLPAAAQQPAPKAEMRAQAQKGQGLVIQGINGSNQPISLVVPLSDFAKAYEGPPTDPKVFEEQQKKLQDELQRRADEARKKLESQQGQPQSSNAPPAPAPQASGKP